VNHTNHPTHNFEGATWHILGELELAIESIAGDATHAWLTDVLHPLNLRADFLNKILDSAQQAIARAVQAESIIKSEHVHLIVFVPSGPMSLKRNWGFFRLEKIENTADGNVDPEHAIEFYLYVEGG
jgi:hypothetical protein